MGLFTKTHIIQSDKSEVLIRQCFSESGDNLIIKEEEKNRYRGRMPYKWGWFNDIISDIEVKRAEQGTELTIANYRGPEDRILHAGFYIVLWGLSFHHLLSSDFDVFQLLFLFFAPPFISLFEMIGFHLRETNAIEAYIRLIKSDKPD